MNTAGLAILVRMGNCLCFKETVTVNGNKYYIRQHIADGGFSSVYLVENARTHKLFALKKIRCHSQDDQKSALMEVEYHQMLSHPNIVECIESDLVGTADITGNRSSEVLMVLPYYQRGTLFDELMKRQSNSNPFDEVTLLSIFQKICEAVQYMHSSTPHPIAHRDIKTSNVLLRDDFTPVLMDLGSATKARVEINGSSDARKLQDEASEKCSMPYRAPELFNVESFCKVDEKTDIWSIGCVLYAMCFYKSPFDAVYERGDSVALAVCSCNVPIPNDHHYSKQLIELIQSMIKVKAEDRPNINDILLSVEQLLNQANGQV